ncbi:hypothetical protein [Burkholderia pseudomallei]|uniref:hypothetical protein n=1 Tax=Burkholderia pseudomallei TaxID=28450 RepID=UPI00351C6336
MSMRKVMETGCVTRAARPAVAARRTIAARAGRGATNGRAGILTSTPAWRKRPFMGYFFERACLRLKAEQFSTNFFMT